MTDTSSNKSLSEEDKKAITDGANWLSQWLTERLNQGILSRLEYNTAIDNLKNIKVYTSDKGYYRLLEALEAGELHFTEDNVIRLAKIYDQQHLYSNTHLTSEQKSIALFREFLEKNPQSPGLFAFHCEEIKEPVIFINVDKQKQFSDDVNTPTLSSLAVHEMTHSLKLNMQEKTLENILTGTEYYNYPSPIANKKVAPVITPEFIFESDTDIPIHKEQEKKTAENAQHILLKDGIIFNAYLDKSTEIYARLMQLRYDFGLKPDEIFTEEQIDEIERRAIKAKEDFKKGGSSTKSDIDFNIINRYRSSMLKDMLNYTADERSHAKSTLKAQEKLSKQNLARNTRVINENKAQSGKKTKKSPNTHIPMQENQHNIT